MHLGDLPPAFIVLLVLGILAGFFKKIFVAVLVTLVAEVILFVLFPRLLVGFVSLITSIHIAH